MYRRLFIKACQYICLCKPFLCKACPVICRIQNPYIPRAGRGGAAHGRVAGRGGARHFGTPTDRFAHETSVHFAFQGIENNCAERLSAATNKGYPIQNRSSPKPGHPSGGTGRGEAGRGGAGRGGAGRIRAGRGGALLQAGFWTGPDQLKSMKKHRFERSRNNRQA